MALVEFQVVLYPRLSVFMRRTKGRFDSFSGGIEWGVGNVRSSVAEQTFVE